MMLKKGGYYFELREHLRKYGGFENDKKVCFVCSKTIPKENRGQTLMFCTQRCAYVYWDLLNKQVKKRKEQENDLQ